MADEYISKEAFTKWIDETFCKKCEAEKRDYHHCRCGYCEYDYMRCDIESFPAADVVPVRHGEWWYTPTHWAYCSICGAYPPEETNAITPYCPNCGAKMDGDVNGGTDS